MRSLVASLGLLATAALLPHSAFSQIAIRGLHTDLSSTADQFTPLDINGDGKTDFLYSRPGGGYAGVYISHGDGTFRYVSYADGGTSQSGFVGNLSSGADTFVPLDINGDGKADFLEFRPGGGYAFACLSLGDGTVNCLTLANSQGQYHGMLDNFQNGNERIIALDLNGDGKSDFILWTRTTGYARAYISQGDGNFNAIDYATGGNPANGFLDKMQSGDENFVAVDLNGDGKSDFVFSSPSHGVVRGYISASNGSGAISSVSTYADGNGDHNGFTGNASDGAGRALALDFNGDGRGDFLWYEPAHGFAAVFLSQPTQAGLVPVSAYILRQNGSGQNGFEGDLSDSADTAIVLDFNGDHKSDFLFYRPGGGYATLYVSNGTNAKLSFFNYAVGGSNSLGFQNNAESSNDRAIPLNFLGTAAPGFLWYSAGGGITTMFAYTQLAGSALGQLNPYSFHANESTFMSDLAWSINNTPMKGIVMPGTHDTAMYVTAKGDIATTQDLNYAGQMGNGARAFDFRVAYYDFNQDQSAFPVRIDHVSTDDSPNQSTCLTGSILPGPGFYMFGHSDYCSSDTAADALQQINSFLENNPKEIMVLDMTEVLSGVNGNQVSNFISLLNQTLGTLIYTQQAACSSVAYGLLNNQCQDSTVFPQNMTAQALWNLNKRLILVDEDSDLMNAGYAWPNSVFGTTGYCDGQGEDTLALEVQCMDIGVKSTAGVQSLRPEFQPYDAAPTFLNLKDAITPYGNYSYLGDALLISPFYASYGLADNDMGFNHYFDGILTGQPKWKPNALNLFNMDAIDSQTYVGDLIARNDQTWTRMNFISPGVPQAATAVAVGANGDVWAAPASGGHAIGLFKYNAATGHWASTISSEPNIKRLAVAPDGGVYVVDGSYGTASNLGHLYHFDKNGNNKTDTGSVVQDVAAGADGSVWAIGVDSSLFHVTGPANAAVTGTPRQTGIRVAVTPIGIPWVLDAAGDIFRYDQPSNTWIQMPGLPATSDSVPVTQVNSSGFGYYDNNVQVFSVGWHAVEFSFGADGSLFAAGIMASRSQTIASGLPSLPGYPSNYSTWRYNSSAQSWDPCKMDATQIAVDPGGHALAIRENTGVLYKGSLDQTH